MRPLSAWFRAHPLTTIFVGVIAFAVGVHIFANWRAEVRWQRYAAEARARGVKLTLTEFAAPKIPDAENFAALPMFRAIIAGGVQRPLELPQVNGKRPTFGDAVKSGQIDWKAWQTFCKDAGWITEITDSPPRDVLRGLEHYAPQFAEWREWPQRPRSRFALDLDLGAALSLPRLSTFMDAAKLFTLRLRAHLALGESAAAYADCQDAVQAYRALVEEPTLIAGLVRQSALTTVLNAVSEGLREHAWGETELPRLDRDLAATAVWRDFGLAFASERAFSNWFYDSLASSSPAKRSQTMAMMSGAAGFSSPETAALLVPRRLFRDNQLRANQYFDELRARMSADGKSYDPDLPTPSDSEHLTAFLDQYYFFLNRIGLPVFSEAITRYVGLQTQLDETRVAIALERWRLARGGFPETLAELVPEFLPAVPVDTYSKKPLIYRRLEGGTFLLYGVGKNRTDDGGVIDPKLGERKQLDDIWLYAPPAL